MKMKKEIGKILGTAAALLAAGCTSTSVVMEYDAGGKLLKRIETREDLSKTISGALRDKSVLIIRSGWAAKIRATPAEMENGGAANVEISVGTRNTAYSSIPARAAASAEIARSHERTISSVLKMRVSADPSGISGSSGENAASAER